VAGSAARNGRHCRGTSTPLKYAQKPCGTDDTSRRRFATCGGTTSAPENAAPVKNFDPEIITIAPDATDAISLPGRVRICAASIRTISAPPRSRCKLSTAARLGARMPVFELSTRCSSTRSPRATACLASVDTSRSIAPTGTGFPVSSRSRTGCTLTRSICNPSTGVPCATLIVSGATSSKCRPLAAGSDPLPISLGPITMLSSGAVWPSSAA
jgi:hypothetical protein